MPLLEARVKSVLSGDTVVLTHVSNPAQERVLSLAYVSAPRLKREGDEPFAFQSREFLRELLVGKVVQFQVLYAIPTGAKREYGIVKVPGANGKELPELCVSEGWAKVREDAGRRDESEDAAVLLNSLRELESRAKSESKGVWAGDDKIDMAYEVKDPQELLEGLKGTPIDSVVEKVLSGDRFLIRLLISPKKHVQTLVVAAGIRAPATKRVNPSDGSEQPGEPYGDQAQMFVEMRLLQRKVKVTLLGLTPQNQLVGTVLHPVGNIAKFLLEAGLARCADHHSTLLGADMAILRQAEKSAKDARKGLFTSHVAPKAAAAAADTDLVVSRILNADTIFLRNKAGVEKKISLSSIRQPKPSDPKQAPFGADAKEFLRKKLIGKHVKVTINGKKPASEGFEEREVGTVLVGNANVAVSLVEAGYASVIRHRRDDDDRSPDYDALLLAEEKAQKEEKGMWSPKPPKVKQFQDYSESVQKAKMECSVLQRQKKVSGVVDFVKSGSRFTVLIPRDNAKLTFVLSGIRAPKSARNANEKSEPFGQEAHDFANRRCMQRDVEIDVETIDKVGGFIGTLYVNRENFAKLLVEEGLATVHAYSAEQSGHGMELFAAEKKAKEARKGLWRDWDPSQDAEDDEGAPAPAGGAAGTSTEAPARGRDYRDVMLTHVDEDGKLKLQQIGAGTTGLTELMDSFRAFHINKANDKPLDGPPKAGELVAARFSEDNEWYRAKVRRNDREAKASDVVYIDYGNSERVPWSRLRPLAPQFSQQKLKPQAVDAAMSFLQFPTSPEYLKDAIHFLASQTVDRELVANVDHTADGVLYVTLLDASASQNLEQSINAEVVREGLAMVPRKLKPWERACSDTLANLRKLEDEAKQERRGMWEYGDITED